MASAERLLRNQLRDSLGEIERLANSIKFNFDELQQRWIVVLLARQWELARDFYRAYCSNSVSGAQIILRSFLECSVDLFNLCGDAGYVDNLEARDLREWLKVMDEAGTKSNPYLRSLGEVDNLDEQRELWQQQLAQLVGKKRGPLTAYDRFAKAGLTELYRSVYNWLCGYSHNTIRALMDRHVTVSTQTVEVYFTRDGPSRLGQWFMYLDLANNLLGQGPCTALKVLGLDEQPAEELYATIELVRQRASDVYMSKQ